MSDSIASIIKGIKDSHSAMVQLYTAGGEVHHLDCVYKEDDAPMFFLAFPPKTIPKDINLEKPCTISLKGAQPPLVLTARPDEVIGDRTLSLKALKAIDPTSMREYFRVDLNTRITASYDPSTLHTNAIGWEITGETIDLSGTGILAVLPKEPKTNKNLFLEIYLDYYKESVTCIGRIIRMTRLRKDKYRVAFHIDEINQKNRDKIITCCLHEQRKILRERVQTS